MPPPSTLAAAARPLRRALWSGALLLAALATAPRALHASESPVPAAAPASTGVAAKPQAAVDPMETLRRRLSEKLGAQTAGDGASAGAVLRVSTRAQAAAPAAHAAAEPTVRAGGTKPKAVERKPDRHAGEAGHAAAQWSYEGAGGPADWGRLQPEFAACSNGKRQSPIDIRDGVKVAQDPVQFDYQSAGFRVVDNGHTIQVNVAPGSAIEAMGQRFELLQFHFHRPSEERVDGRQFDMVAHLVHKSAEGRLAVVAVLLERGSVQPLLQQVWANLPLEKGDEVRARGTIDLNQLLPAERGYFAYMGSLTTPPCSEGVLWMVLKQPVQVSPEQVGVFSRLYPMNARPIQSASGG